MLCRYGHAFSPVLSDESQELHKSTAAMPASENSMASRMGSVHLFHESLNLRYVSRVTELGVMEEPSSPL